MAGPDENLVSYFNDYWLMVNIQVGCVLVHFSIKVVEKKLALSDFIVFEMANLSVSSDIAACTIEKVVNLLSNAVVQLIIFNYFALSHLSDSYKVNIYVKTTCNFWFDNVGKFTENSSNCTSCFLQLIIFLSWNHVLKKLLILLELQFHEKKNQMLLKIMVIFLIMIWIYVSISRKICENKSLLVKFYNRETFGHSAVSDCGLADESFFLVKMTGNEKFW